jgi:hypothetical protein
LYVEKLLSRLRKVRKVRDYSWTACCPAHDDHSPSLAITEEPHNGRVLLYCHAGCGGADVVAAVGLALSDLYEQGPLKDYLPSAISRTERRKREHEELIIKVVQADLKAGKRVSAADAERAKLAAKRLERLCRVD